MAALLPDCCLPALNSAFLRQHKVRRWTSPCSLPPMRRHCETACEKHPLVKVPFLTRILELPSSRETGWLALWVFCMLRITERRVQFQSVGTRMVEMQLQAPVHHPKVAMRKHLLSMLQVGKNPRPAGSLCRCDGHVLGVGCLPCAL